jgi:hypothetical protein
MKTSNVIVILGLMLCFGQAYAINQYRVFGDGRWDLDLSGSFFRSTANYSTTGTNQAFVDNNYYQLMNAQAGIRWGLLEMTNVYLYTDFASAESKATDATRSNSGFTNVIAGTEFLLDFDFMQVIPEMSYLYNTEKISNSQDAVLNSEGINELTGKVNLQFDFDSFLLYGFGGFTYRDGGRSNLFPWGINAEYSGEKMAFGGELFGFQSITDDKDSGNANETARDALRARVSAGSAHFYALDPNVVDSNIYVKYAPSSRWLTWAAAGTSILGSNYSNGWHVEAGLRWTFGGNRRSYDDGRKIRSEKKVEQFKEDTNDGVDQKMFRPNPTQPAPQKKKVEGQEQINDKMKDVDMSIELKKNKKKKRVR